MFSKKTFLLSVLLMSVLVLFMVGCENADKTINSDAPVFNDDSQTHDSPELDSYGNLNPLIGNEISVDSLHVLVGKLYANERAKGEAPSKAVGWVFNIPMPSFYSQIEPAWRYDKLGYNKCKNSTIGRYGCHLCCVAMLYAKWGFRNVTPPVLNNWSFANWDHYAFDYYKDCGDLIRIPQALQYPGMSRNYQWINYDQIYTALKRGYPVVIEIKYNNGSHFMVIYAFDGSRYWVLDPLRPPAQGAVPLWGTGYGGSNIKSIRLYGYRL